MQACGESIVGAVPDQIASDSCDEAEPEFFVGHNADILEDAMFDVPVRIIGEGMAVTMDYSPERINFELDAGEVIIRVYCG